MTTTACVYSLQFELIRLLVLGTAAFMITALCTPPFLHLLTKYKMGKQIRTSGEAPIYAQLHANKSGTPTMGGVLIWGTMILLIGGLAIGSVIWPHWSCFSFLTQRETLLPLGVLLASALVGLIDDLFNVKQKGLHGGGLRKRHRILIYTSIAVVGALWFYFKLDWDLLHIPFLGNYQIGWWSVPFIIFVIVATSFSVNETDGLDGLAGGTLLMAYGAFAVIAFLLGRYELAVFCTVIIGAMLAFLWWNIFPAKIIMGDTGAMSLGVTLGVIAILTNYVLLLPFIGFIFVVEALSFIIQTTSKRWLKRKVFLSAPIHHHLEAKHWTEPTIVMRFWIIATITAALGIILFLLDRGIGS